LPTAGALSIKVRQNAAPVMVMVRQAHHDNVIPSLSNGIVKKILYDLNHSLMHINLHYNKIKEHTKEFISKAT